MKDIVTTPNNWARKTEKMKLMFVHLTDTDFRYAPGKKSEMMSNLKKRLCMSEGRTGFSS